MNGIKSKTNSGITHRDPYMGLRHFGGESLISSQRYKNRLIPDSQSKYCVMSPCGQRGRIIIYVAAKFQLH